MSLDNAERKIKALTRLVKAQESGLLGSPVIVSYDPQGATPEGAERVFAREMAAMGLEKGDLEEAGLEPIFVNLPWAAGRNVGQGKYQNDGDSE